MFLADMIFVRLLWHIEPSYFMLLLGSLMFANQNLATIAMLACFCSCWHLEPHAIFVYCHCSFINL